MAPPRSTSTVADPQSVPRADATRLLDIAPVGMLLTDRSGTLVYANRACINMLGYDELAIAGLTLHDLVHDEDDTAFHLQVDRLARGETRSWRGEHRFRHADNSALWVMVAANLLDGDAGEPDLIIVQLTSIELQKKAEEALAYSESRWNFALESARQGVWDHDVRTDTMFYSRMWRIMRGISPDEEVDGNQQLWLSRIHPEDRPQVIANVSRQERSDDTFEGLEYREMKRDGTYVWILSRGRAVEWDENGVTMRTVGTDTDITHLKTIERELAAEKERLRITLASIADGMISADANGMVEFMNVAAEQLTGLSASAAHGRPVRDVFRIRDHGSGAIMDCPVWTCFEEGKPIRVEDDAILVGHDGTERDIRCTAAPVLGSNDKIIGAVLVFEDVTQSRALQRQLAHTASHDALTGLTNRAAFEQAMLRAEHDARFSGAKSVLIYIDLDHFKPVNDGAGHAAGDELLRQIARTISECCRSHDIVARIGGDEFAVILFGCPTAKGKSIAENIVRAIAALDFVWSGRSHRVGASAGLTEINASPASSLGFMGEADAACYAAKAAGRGQVVDYRQMLEARQP